MSKDHDLSVSPKIGVYETATRRRVYWTEGEGRGAEGEGTTRERKIGEQAAEATPS